MNKISLFCLLLMAMSSSCTPSFSPVDLQSNDVCARCRKNITDKKTAGEIVFMGGEAMKFNDLGCLIAFHFGVDTTTEHAVFVQDYYNGGWVSEDEAFVLYHSKVATPMNSGSVSFKTQSDAMRAKEKLGGEVRTLTELLKKESIWLE